MLSRSASELRRVRGKVAHTLSSTFLQTLARAAKLHPRSRPSRHRVEVETNVRYRPGAGPEHVLDIYRPIATPGERPAPLPVVFYVHGGAFQILSKDTHWLMGLAFARRGYLVFNISYRLAPRHRFPAAIDDTCAAWLWMLANVERLGGDPARLAVAGESAGGNLIAALTLATVQRRREPYAQAVFDAGVVPRAALPFCAILEVSRGDRFARRRPLPDWLDGMMRSVEHAYLGDHRPTDCDLADPLCVFERAADAQEGTAAGGEAFFERPLPPFFAPVGTRDPLLDDTRRLEKALRRLQVPCEARYYADEIHAFHALVWRRQARTCWRDALAFLDAAMR
jgi:acetyl esterase